MIDVSQSVTRHGRAGRRFAGVCAGVTMVLVVLTFAAAPAGAASTTTYCLSTDGQFTSCPSGALTVGPAPVVSPATSPSAPGASLPYTAPPPSHPAVVLDSGISIGLDLRPAIVGIVIIAVDVVIAGSFIAVRRRQNSQGGLVPAPGGGKQKPQS